MTQLEKLNDKKILILGLQKEGLSTLSFCKKNISYKKIGVADINEKKISGKNISTHFGKNYLSAVKKYDVIIITPGIPLSSITLKKGQVVTSQSDIFLANCKAKIIGITGTKGKSTTAQLIYNMLSESGKNCFLVGNIGTPPLNYLGKEKATDWFVCELSSFQLQTIKKSPHIAVILNIYRDHLDYHKNNKEYILAKKNITKFQNKNDFVIYNKQDEKVKEIIKKTKAKKIGFINKKIKNKNITIFTEPVIKVGETLKISKKNIDSSIKKFKGLPYRTEYVGAYKGIRFYNDSAATIPEATAMAIKNIPSLQTIIIGGSEKGSDTKILVETIKKSKIKNVIILGEIPSSLASDICNINKSIYNVFSMQDAVLLCYLHTNKNMACALSPGFASFNMFKNYKERGDIFVKEVLKKK